MKKFITLLLAFFSVLIFSQSIFEAKSTKDRSVVEAFISKNPNHPAVPELRKKLLTMPYSNNSSEAKPKIRTMTESRIEKTSKVGTSAEKGEPSEQAKNTAAMLTHILNNEKNDNKAVLQFVNKSKCVLAIKVSGKKFYNLTVPANNQSYIMVDKGSYNITTMVCDARYNQTKQISKDLILTLSN